MLSVSSETLTVLAALHARIHYYLRYLRNDPACSTSPGTLIRFPEYFLGRSAPSLSLYS